MNDTVKTTNKGKNKTKPLTRLQARIVKEYMSGKHKTLADVGMAVKDYKTRDSAKQAAHRIMTDSNVQARHPEILNRNGITEDRIAQELDELLHANKTVFFSHQGEVTDERQVPDNTVRVQALKVGAEVHGMIGYGSRDVNIKNLNYLDMRKLDDSELAKIIAEGKAAKERIAEYEVIDNNEHSSEHVGTTQIANN